MINRYIKLKASYKLKLFHKRNSYLYYCKISNYIFDINSNCFTIVKNNDSAISFLLNIDKFLKFEDIIKKYIYSTKKDYKLINLFKYEYLFEFNAYDKKLNIYDILISHASPMMMIEYKYLKIFYDILLDVILILKDNKIKINDDL